MFRNRPNRLFERFRDHADGDALGALFDEAAPRLFKLACHLVREPAVAEDLVQTTFLVAIAHPERFDGSGPVEGWLYGILWREAARARRQAARRPEDLASEPSVESDPLAGVVSEETRSVVAQVVARLPKKHREVLEPFLCAEQRAEEIALSLGRSPSTVRTQIHRSMQRLRRALPRGLAGLPSVVGGPTRGLDYVRAEVMRSAGVAPHLVAVAPGTAIGLSLGAALLTKQALALMAVVLLFAGWMLWNPQPEQATNVQVAALDAVSKPPIEPSPVVTAGADETASRAALSVDPVHEAAKAPDVTRLTVRTVAKETRKPVAMVRVYAFVKDLAKRGGSLDHFAKGTRGDLDHAPLTSGDGLVDFDLPPGVSLWLWFMSQDATSGTVREFEVPGLSPGERREIVVELPTELDLHYFGRLVVKERGTPIQGGVVELHFAGKVIVPNSDGNGAHGEVIAQPITSCVSDADGRFDLRLRSWQEPDVRASADGYSEVLVQITREHDTVEKAKEIPLPRSASLRARILDSKGGSITDASVHISTHSYNVGVSDHGEMYLPWPEEVDWEAAASALGDCTFKKLPAEVPLEVEILRAGKVVRRDVPELSLLSGEAREVEWRVGVGGFVEGRMIDQAGKPVARYQVWMQRADFDEPFMFRIDPMGGVRHSTATDAEGHYSFADVDAGAWWIGPAATREDWDPATPEAIAPLASVVQIAEGTSRQKVDLRVHRGLYIRGKVITSAGAPAPETSVLATSDVMAWIVTTQAQEDGSYSLGPLVPGRYKLAAQAAAGEADSAEVEAGEKEEGITLQLRSAGSASGTVVDAATGSAAEATVKYALQGHADESWSEAPVDKSGGFVANVIAAGTYDFSATGTAGGACILRGVIVKAGETTSGLKLKLSPGARVRLRLDGNDGAATYRVSQDGVTLAEDRVSAGKPLVVAVPAGHLLVEVNDRRKWREAQQLDLAVGEEKEVVLSRR